MVKPFGNGKTRNQAMDRIEAFILVGGASSRMGSDKSKLELDGQTFTQRIAGTLREVVTAVTVVGRESHDLQLPGTNDIYPQWGALGGVHGALATCQSEWAFVVACDLPFVTKDLLNRLASMREDYEAVAPIQKDGRPQPLCSLYRVEPCLRQATRMIEAGERRPVDLLKRVNTRWLPFVQLQDLQGAERFFVNINTPEDYYEATRKGAVIKK
jgi:molybdopterin-guanine dinucleotide biosynthesis protein A